MKIYNSSGGNLPVSRLKISWIEAVEEDSKKIPSIRNWKREVMDRQEWRGYIRDINARYRDVKPYKKNNTRGVTSEFMLSGFV
jgi:ribosome modulation factor